jgi:hypothetical protein
MNVKQLFSERRAVGTAISVLFCACLLVVPHVAAVPPAPSAPRPSKPEKGPSGPAGEMIQVPRPDWLPVSGPQELSAERERSSQSAQTGPTWINMMFEDFEGSFPDTKWHLNWQSDPSKEGYGYVWDDVSYRARSGLWSGWCADENYQGQPDIDPPGPYPAEMASWMIYGPFDLRDATQAQLSFCTWYDIEIDYDYLFVGAAKDGGDFEGRQFDGNSDGWKCEVLDLWAKCGESDVEIGFAFISDDSYGLEGAYLDDIYLWKYVDNYTPTNEAVYPLSGGANSGVTQNFDTTWSDANGAYHLKHCFFHVGDSPSIVGNVTLMYNAQKDKLWIRSDDGTEWLGGYAPGSANILENSQARVYCEQAFVNRYTQDVTVRWPIEFKSSFWGPKKTGLKCKDVYKAKAKGEWKGTWMIFYAGSPVEPALPEG